MLLDQKANLNFKIYDANQSMKFGQLIEYNMRNIFLKNHAQYVLEKLAPGLSLKTQNWA